MDCTLSTCHPIAKVPVISACRYDAPEWTDCDPFELVRFRVLRLIHGGSQCEEVKNITKHCTPHEFPYGKLIVVRWVTDDMIKKKCTNNIFTWNCEKLLTLLIMGSVKLSSR